MIRLGIRVRADDAEAAFAGLEPVLAAGAEEVAHGAEVEFAIYGDDVPDARLRSLFPRVVSISRSLVPPGWETTWHRHLEPVTVGALTIRPPWIEGDGLVVDPGTSFGLAGHATTRLCLELLQTLPRTPLVDWGCGCGVLSVAAAALGFEVVAAIEIDPDAVATARANGVDASVGDVLRDPPWAPTVVANLTLPLLEAAAAPGPALRLIASGMLDFQADDAVAAWAPHGFVERERRELDGWAALLLERA